MAGACWSVCHPTRSVLICTTSCELGSISAAIGEGQTHIGSESCEAKSCLRITFSVEHIHTCIREVGAWWVSTLFIKVQSLCATYVTRCHVLFVARDVREATICGASKPDRKHFGTRNEPRGRGRTNRNWDRGGRSTTLRRPADRSLSCCRRRPPGSCQTLPFPLSRMYVVAFTICTETSDE